jgi:hypothetical protein
MTKKTTLLNTGKETKMTKKTSPRDIPANPNRRRLLAMCLPVAVVLPWFSTPLTAALTRIWKGVFDGRFAQTTVSVQTAWSNVSMAASANFADNPASGAPSNSNRA